LYLPVRPAYADVSLGGSAGDFLQFEVGGRPSGMAGAHVGSASGITAQFWNPAALSALDQQQVGAMHATWLGDLKYEWIGYARPMGRIGVGSVSVAYFHMPGIAGFDEFNNPTGDFKVYDMALTVGLARPVGKVVSVGANAKLIRQNLASVSANGVAADLGATVNVAGTTFGAVVQNLGPSLSFGSVSYPLPRQIRFGASRGFLGGRVLLATDYNIPNDYYHDVRVGTEVRAHPNISLRAGYRHELGGGDDPATGLSYGLGINLKQMSVDYAMTPSDAFDDVHRLSFGYSFGSGVREKESEPKKPEETKPAPPPAPVGPPIIVQAKPDPPAPNAVKSSIEPPKPSASAPSAPPAPSSVLSKEELAARPPSPANSGYAVVLPGFQSKESAQAEIRALELLGFRTKDAQISRDPKRGGYVITLARMKSKGNADEMAASLHRMSFRATVDLVER
jgi:hypothetical protein